MTLETELAKGGVRLALLAVTLAVLGVIGWRLYDWVYDRGVEAERSTWVAAQAKADKEQQAREAAAQADSDAATATAAQESQQSTQAVATATAATQDAIQREYEADPAKAASCTPDLRPAAIPDGVLDQLRQARRAAEAAAG